MSIWRHLTARIRPIAKTLLTIPVNGTTMGAMTHNRLFRSRDAALAALSGFAGHAVYGEPYQRH